jgi:hypothetical protein
LKLSALMCGVFNWKIVRCGSFNISLATVH